MERLHIWKRKNYRYDSYDYVATRMKDPVVGDMADVNVECSTDMYGLNATYENFNSWKSIEDVKTNSSKIIYGQPKPYVTVVVTPEDSYGSTITTIYGPGVVPKKYVSPDFEGTRHFVSKHFWPDGVTFKVVFDCESYDLALEKLCVSRFRKSYYEDNYLYDGSSMIWNYDSNTDTVTVATNLDGYCVEIRDGYNYDDNDPNLSDYIFFNIRYTGIQ